MSIVRCPYCHDFMAPVVLQGGVVRCSGCAQLFDGTRAWPKPVPAALAAAGADTCPTLTPAISALHHIRGGRPKRPPHEPKEA